MNMKMRTAYFLLPTLTVLFLSSCVSRDEYLTKVKQSDELSSELTKTRSQCARLEEEKEALEKERRQLKLQTLSLEDEIDRLRKDATNLEETSGAESNKLRKQIEKLEMDVVELKRQNLLLKEENRTLGSKILDLDVRREEETLTMKTTYDDLLEDMKTEIERGKITITELKGRLKVNLVDEILFDSGRSSIKPDGIEILRRVGKILLTVKNRSISVEGHTDNVPIGPELAKTYPTNWELSVARATNVVRYLQDKIGVDPGLLSATGHGEYQPVTTNATAEGRAKNRRIEIIIVPQREEGEVRQSRQ